MNKLTISAGIVASPANCDAKFMEPVHPKTESDINLIRRGNNESATDSAIGDPVLSGYKVRPVIQQHVTEQFRKWAIFPPRTWSRPCHSLQSFGNAQICHLEIPWVYDMYSTDHPANKAWWSRVLCVNVQSVISLTQRSYNGPAMHNNPNYTLLQRI